MGTGEARGKPSKDVLMSPAPNTYSPSRNPTLLKSPSWAVGTSKRRPLSSRNPNPGPGSYSHTISGSAPAVSFNDTINKIVENERKKCI